jgi:hypothetical protein
MLRAFFSLVLACLCVHAAFGQTDALHYRDWETGAAGGVSLMAGKSEFNTRVFDGSQTSVRTVGMNYESGYQWGYRVGEYLGDYWAADLEYSFANQPLRFTNLSPTVASISLGQSVHHFSYSISYLPFSRLKRFRAYGKLGTGATLYYIHGDSKTDALDQGLRLEDTWKFLVNWGGGMKYLAGNQVALTFDVRDNMTGVPSYGLPRSARVVNGQYFPGMATNGLLHNWQLNVGVAFQWDD